MYAAVALAGFALATTAALIAWFATVSEPWTWKSLVAIASVLFALTVAVLVYRLPTREHAIGGAMVLGASLLRVGPPSEWNGATAALFVLTALAAGPVVYAIVKLPRE